MIKGAKMDNSINLINVQKILKDEYKFDLPIYQRGYRWTENEVNTLIDDINGCKKEESYFLQVLTVKKEKDGKFLLIDGQQRLTTIFLLLGEKLETYFPNREDDKINKFYIEKIDPMLKKVDEEIKEKLKNASFLLYEVNEIEDDNEIFERLNSGKIPLSSAEILKAKAISEINDESKKTEFAQRWQFIEKVLQDDVFFFYICPYRDSERYEKTRMDYILELLYASGKKTTNAKLNEEYEKNPLFVFNDLDAKYKYKYDQLLDEIENLAIANLYGKIFCHTSLYNAFGYYLYKKGASFPNIEDIKEREISFDIFFDKYEKVEELAYGNEKTYNALLQYNILKHIKNRIRFDFVRYSQEDYDVEHIYARNSQDLDSETIKRLIRNIIEIKKFRSTENKNISSLITDYDYECDQGKEENLSAYYNLFMDLSEGGNLEKDDSKEGVEGFSISFAEGSSIVYDKDNIKNLTLLPSSVNRRISNYPFPIKVQKVIESKARNGYYIPEFAYRLYLCNEAKPRWGNLEAQEYLEDIKDTLSKMGELK